MAKAKPIDPTIVDGASLFDLAEVIAERFNRPRVTVDYVKLRERLESMRQAKNWRPSSMATLILSADPNSEGQQRFQSMVRHSGWESDVVHFRDAFVSLPPGRAPNEATARSQVSLSSRIAYIAGLMARHTDPHFLVLSHSFELHGPLTNLARRVPEGKVGLAYFGSFIDYRWKVAGLLDGKLDITFFDLDQFGQELLGVDLVFEPTGPSDDRGLGRF